MNTTTKHSQEVHERAVRPVLEHQDHHESKREAMLYLRQDRFLLPKRCAAECVERDSGKRER